MERFRISNNRESLPITFSQIVPEPVVETAVNLANESIPVVQTRPKRRLAPDSSIDVGNIIQTGPRTSNLRSKRTRAVVDSNVDDEGTETEDGLSETNDSQSTNDVIESAPEPPNQHADNITIPTSPLTSPARISLNLNTTESDEPPEFRTARQILQSSMLQSVSPERPVSEIPAIEAANLSNEYIYQSMTSQEKSEADRAMAYLETFRLFELKAVLAAVGLPISGRKRAQIIRIQDTYHRNPDVRVLLRDKINEMHNRMMNVFMTGNRTSSPLPGVPEIVTTMPMADCVITTDQDPFSQEMKTIGQWKLKNSHHFGPASDDIDFALENTDLELLRSADPLYKLALSCYRQKSLSKIQYPNFCRVNCNNNPLKVLLVNQIHEQSNGSNTGVAVDISQFVTSNSVMVRFNWNGDVNVYIVIIKLLRNKTDLEMLIHLKSQPLSKESILEDRFNTIFSQDDIVSVGETISLKDPVTLSRIKNPIRSKKCKHIQCFDAGTFITMNRAKGRWECPVCNSKVQWSELILDGYFKDILENTSMDCESVLVDPSGSWTVSEQQDNKNGTANNSSSEDQSRIF